MSKRPSLFAARPLENAPEPLATETAPAAPASGSLARGARTPSRAGKRVVTIYLDPTAWKQLGQLALDNDKSIQALGEEAFNLLFTQHGLNRSA